MGQNCVRDVSQMLNLKNTRNIKLKAKKGMINGIFLKIPIFSPVKGTRISKKEKKNLGFSLGFDSLQTQ